jgi:adenylylsulfate kinase-like enzyme
MKGSIMKSNGHQNEVILVRGLPGSGKSTLAKNMDGYLHFEADIYLEIDGIYVYDATIDSARIIRELFRVGYV